MHSHAWKRCCEYWWFQLHGNWLPWQMHFILKAKSFQLQASICQETLSWFRLPMSHPPECRGFRAYVLDTCAIDIYACAVVVDLNEQSSVYQDL